MLAVGGTYGRTLGITGPKMIDMSVLMHLTYFWLC